MEDFSQFSWKTFTNPCAQLMSSRTWPRSYLSLCFTLFLVLKPQNWKQRRGLHSDSNWTISSWVPLGYNRQHFPMPLLPKFLIRSLDCHSNPCQGSSYPPEETGMMKEAVFKKQSFSETSQLSSHSSVKGFLLIPESENQMCNRGIKQLLSMFEEEGGSREGKGWQRQEPC